MLPDADRMEASNRNVSLLFFLLLLLLLLFLCKLELLSAPMRLELSSKRCPRDFHSISPFLLLSIIAASSLYFSCSKWKKNKTSRFHAASSNTCLFFVVENMIYSLLARQSMSEWRPASAQHQTKSQHITSYQLQSSTLLFI